MLNSLLFAMLLASDSLSITFTGDVLLDRGVRQFVEHRSVDKLFSPFVDSVFQSSDLVVANLECPATKIRQPAFKQYIFRAEPEWLQTLKAHGITHLNLANNHSVDQGRIGLADTKKNIQETGMIPVGAGDNMQEAAQPVLLASSPRNVYLLTSLQMPLENFSYLPDKTSVSHEDLDSLKTRVRQLKETDPCCYIIVSLHWGGEHTLKPVPLQRQQAHQLIDAGADALICHHTHTLQTIEQYQGKPIYYSIGNFIFDQKKPINSKACMVKVTIKKESSHIETIPIVIRNCVPEKP
ncbi:MAG: CapA family protein [Prevotella sp.]|nr:CapA family protein [Prevotella sp.]